jgi:hypothetical protein
LLNWFLEAAFAGKWSRVLFRDRPAAAPALLDAVKASEEAPA